ncbi:hypothetical protein DOTSEDRAFT_74651 [Dothistroma septosporum NZE10]|uniref:Uncharacterized protein n=1 Tax=Dothistroma septosporum (strain NZE10 / CBS 128990) TaxID=675120 RepID=N1PE16_DOTSN|nr:hypothetical protein DOTSEDRAFT_74651 [Dothistroma septosporum NZE10]
MTAKALDKHPEDADDHTTLRDPRQVDRCSAHSRVTPEPRSACRRSSFPQHVRRHVRDGVPLRCTTECSSTIVNFAAESIIPKYLRIYVRNQTAGMRVSLHRHDLSMLLPSWSRSFSTDRSSSGRRWSTTQSPKLSQASRSALDHSTNTGDIHTLFRLSRP